MPHLLLSDHKQISTPTIYDGVEFDFVAHHPLESKIAVKTDNKEFLLTLKNKDNNKLLKLDTSTRVSPVSLAQKALNSYANLCGANILFSNTQPKTKKLEPKKEYLKDIEYFVHSFSTTKDIYIEVGFGSGRHLIYQALQNPDKLIIGLEIHTPSIEQMLKQVKLQNITNIIAVNYDARLFLEFLDSNSVQRIFVHFPVPWDKKPHRRVLSDEFINESLRVLKPNGTLELRTDSIKYFEYTQELIKHFANTPTKIIKNQDIDITSKYETRWKKQGKDIWDVIFTSTTKDAKIKNQYDFNFENKIISLENLTLPNKPMVKKDFFIHFEYRYITDKSNGLIKLTFGSFNKPVTKYILVQDGKLSYYQGLPLPTSANYKAHNLIKEVIFDIS